MSIHPIQINQQLSIFWKEVLIVLLNENNSVFLPLGKIVNLENDIDNKKYNELVELISKTSYKKTFDDVVKFYQKDADIDVLDSTAATVINDSLMAFKKLEHSGYVKGDSDLTLGATSFTTKYTLTDNGVDIALKLQEHTDNDRRHSVTVSYSKKAFWISIGALTAAIISACFNYQRLNLYEKQVNQMMVNQAAIFKKVKEAKAVKK